MDTKKRKAVLHCHATGKSYTIKIDASHDIDDDDFDYEEILITPIEEKYGKKLESSGGFSWDWK